LLASIPGNVNDRFAGEHAYESSVRLTHIGKNGSTASPANGLGGCYVLSCNVGQPRSLPSPRGPVTSGIFKYPVSGRVSVSRTNIDGDAQADLRVHGGKDKAVYCYPSEHYAYWSAELLQAGLSSWGAFGENLTTVGIDESSVNVGDTLRIGTVLLQVTQPRMPCYKLALKFGHGDMIAKFAKSGRSGFYVSVLEEGELRPGDAITISSANPPVVGITDLLALLYADSIDVEIVRRALGTPALPVSWRDWLARRFQI
jgi:MOSC domain-containing protein YiiM